MYRGPASILIGTSGWHYPTGKGTWNGAFYPARRPRGFDELSYYAERFDIVEVNSTFYRMPDAGQVATWVTRTPRDFQFTIKLFQKFTHPDMYLARAGVTDWNLSLADIDAFKRGLAPLAGAGKLAAVLVQFPPSFHADEAMRDYLTWMLTSLAGYRLAVELRHKSWFATGSETGARLAAGHASLVVADDPGTGVLSTVPVDHTSAALYLRLHGRNAAAWWNHAAAEDRYNYLYSPTELMPFSAAAREASQAGRPVMAFMNNHFSAKAVANAAILKSQLGQSVPGDYERSMVDRYPDLTGVVTTSGLPL
ncbi:MAG: DUF72 domain-containing protein [Acidobacteria bacterium]|nr:DUF72 domain-containing protein [Acidobacteriota bacterium]